MRLKVRTWILCGGLFTLLCSCTWMYAQCPNGVCYPQQTTTSVPTSTTGIYRWYPGYGWYYETATPTETVVDETESTEEDPVVGPVETKKVVEQPKEPEVKTDKEVVVKKKALPDAPAENETVAPKAKETKTESIVEPVETEDALQPIVMASTDKQSVMSLPTMMVQKNGERETNALKYLNKVRADKGLPVLTLRTSATIDTRRHCHYMYTVKQLSSIPKTQECTGYWEGNAERMVKAWLKTPNCAAILLNEDAKEVSIGTEANYWTVRVF